MSNLIFKGSSLKGIVKKAKEILFDNSNTSLSATDVQGAIEELDTDLSDTNTKLTALGGGLIRLATNINVSGTTTAYGYLETQYNANMYDVIYSVAQGLDGYLTIPTMLTNGHLAFWIGKIDTNKNVVPHANASVTVNFRAFTEY